MPETPPPVAPETTAATAAGPLGILAGGGQFPLLCARAARDQGRKTVVIAHRGETDPAIEEVADRVEWVKLGQLGRVIENFHRNDVREAVLLGTITKTRIFREVWPDLRALALWRRINVRQDDAILRALAGEIEREGIRILPSTLYLEQLLFPAGVLTSKAPSPEQWEDIHFGWRIAKEIGRLDIGQTVVVRDRSVLAVEAMEGTDQAIRRGGQLAGGGAVVVKVRKPGQDFRFDLPATGPGTIESLRQSAAAVLAVEAGQSLLFDPQAMMDAADGAGIVVVGLRTEEMDSEP